MKLLIIIIFIASFEAKANSLQDQVLQFIVKARDGQRFKSDSRLAKLIIKASEKYELSPIDYALVLAVESMFRLDAINHASNDFGIAQINSHNVKALDLDKKRLLNDLEYSIMKGAFILSYFKNRYSKIEVNWLCRYNIGTARELSLNQYELCQVYMDKINKYKKRSISHEARKSFN